LSYRLKDLLIHGWDYGHKRMHRKISLLFPRPKVKLEAELLEEKAPATCASVWSVLPKKSGPNSTSNWPEKGQVHHGITSGTWIYVLIPTPPQVPAAENQTYNPEPGDLMFFSIKPEGSFTPGLPKTFCEIGIAYERQINLMYGPNGRPVPYKGNVFGRIVGGLKDLKTVGDDIRVNGEYKVAVTQIG
jgi:hypothetical protein